MSKVNELAEKYSSVNKLTFNKFVNSDKTPTKKYLEYLLLSWKDKSTNGCPNNSEKLVNLVNRFDKLIPYIENKDIYHPYYRSVINLKTEIERAELIKEEKTFVREDHVEVLIETDEFLMVRPITHRGSLKYGANTRWCVASKTDVATFNRYVKDGVLVYLIDKTNQVKPQLNKMALYERNNCEDSMSGQIEIYNPADVIVRNDGYFIDMGWKHETLSQAFYIFRSYFFQRKKIKKAEDYVQNFQKLIENVNIDKLNESIQILTGENKVKNTERVLDELNQITNKLSEIKNGFTKA